jgi:hypothetical protein
MGNNSTNIIHNAQGRTHRAGATCCARQCRYEEWRENPSNPDGMDGVNCNWICEDVLVGQRLSSEKIRDYGVEKKFQVGEGDVEFECAICGVPAGERRVPQVQAESLE